MSAWFIALVVLLWIVASATVLACLFRKEIERAWREPALSAPVLVIESDDWGYGPPEQAERLAQIGALLLRHKDHMGHPAVMTLGVMLAGPDTARMAAEGGAEYRRTTLAAHELAAVRSAMRRWAGERVFALQLHGMEHFWPPALLTAAAREAPILAWLTGPALPETERLPPALQSRWVDAGVLPSRNLPALEIEAAVREETRAFHEIFGQPAEVVVPPTFVWTPEVEAAWARHGLRVLITPGRRYEGRDAAGRPRPANETFHNGQRSPGGMTYLVRDDYFEPAQGHRADRALAALEGKTRLGRPTLLETHRANFLGERETVSRSLHELDRLLGEACRRWPGLRFMAGTELARQYACSGALVEKRLTRRLQCTLFRLARIARLRRLAWLTGIALPLGLVMALGPRLSPGRAQGEGSAPGSG